MYEKNEKPGSHIIMHVTHLHIYTHTHTRYTYTRYTFSCKEDSCKENNKNAKILNII